MALSKIELDLIEQHHKSLSATRSSDLLMDTYYDASQLVHSLGLSVPSYRDAMSVIGWPQLAVDAWTNRTDLRAMTLPGTEAADPQLRDIWDANNLDSDLSLFMIDRYVYGRAFLSVGANEDDAKTPMVHVESPLTMSMMVDQRRRTATSACKVYGVDESGNGPQFATLYLPNETIWAVSSNGTWSEERRNRHNLGRVPVVMSLHARRTGSWRGRSAINSTLRSLADAATRTVTNMAFASEAHGIPQRWAVGLAKGDFVDSTGKPLPAWQARMEAIWASGNKDAKFGNFEQTDLKNFATQMDVLVAQAAAASHLPQRFFGEKTSQPPNADAIRADEVELVTFVKAQNRQVGAVLGWAAGLALRIANGEWVDGSRIGVEFHDPATPTIAQREDALSKRRAAGVLSREGYWDELGWSEARKAKEREYLRAESSDPLMAAFNDLMGGSGGAAESNA